MLKLEQYHTKDYTQNEFDEITKLLTEYTDEQKKKVALLLMDLANIYANSTD